MRPVAVHQLTAGIAPHDAISQHVLASQDLLRSWGFDSRIYSDNIHPAVAHRAHPGADLPADLGPDDLLIVHYSIDSPIFAAAGRTRARLAMYYHNITPASLLWRFAPAVARECALGRERLPDLARRVTASWAVSRFNAQELDAVGYPPTRVLGILGPERTPAPARTDPPAAPRLLFVGRGIPNKAQHDLVLALAALHEVGRPARLALVGDWGSAPDYREYCLGLARRLGVESHLEVLGGLDHDGLRHEYDRADLFLCLSDHEGYCVPLVEAMAAALPIVALAAGAVPETLGAAGLLLDEKPPSLVAEAVMAVIDRPPLRAAMADGRRTRLEQLGPGRVATNLRAAIEDLA